MPKKELVDSLQKLHEVLNDAQEVDEETLALLAHVRGDLERILQQQPEHADEEFDSAISPVKDWLLDFESRHPQVASLMEEITTLLGNLGI